MGILDIFKIKKSFPKVEKGNVKLVKDTIIYDDGRGNDPELLDLTVLKYVFVTMLGGQPYLMLFSNHQHHIACNLKGFQNVYKALSKRFGFNDSAFFEVINQTKDIKKRLWIHPEKTNFKLLDNEYSDFENGIEVLSDPPIFISWDITQFELIALQVGETYTSDTDIVYFKFSYPVRIGNMIIDNLECYVGNNRENIGVQNYFANLTDQSLTSKSYYDIKNNWLKRLDLKNNVDETGWERSDQNHIIIYLTKSKDIYFSLSYNFSDQSNYDSGSTSFYITNDRDYSTVLTDISNKIPITISHSFILQQQYSISENYKNNNYVSITPQVVMSQLNNKSIIWYDANTKLLGFSDNNLSLIYPINDLDKVIIYNVLPARGAGYSELRIRLKNGDLHFVFSTNTTYEFDEIANLINQWTDLETEISGPWYND